MLWFFRQMREKRRHIENKADALIDMHGDPAYFVARDNARASAALDPKQRRFWSKVAVLIAKKTNYTIGEKVADRYLSRSEASL